MLILILKWMLIFLTLFSCRSISNSKSSSLLSQTPGKTYQAHIVSQGGYGYALKINLPLKKGTSQTLVVKVLKKSRDTIKESYFPGYLNADSKKISQIEKETQTLIFQAIEGISNNSLGYNPVPRAYSDFSNFEISDQDLVEIIYKNENVMTTTLVKLLKNNLVMDYISGLPLNQYANKNLSKHEIQYISHQLLLAIKLFIRSCYVHSDLKPSNIILSSFDKKMRLYIIDYGAGELMIPPLSELPCKALPKNDDTYIGTEEYSSFSHLGIDNYFLSDLRSLASTIFVLLYNETINPDLLTDPALDDHPILFNEQLKTYLEDALENSGLKNDPYVENISYFIYYLLCRQKSDLKQKGEFHYSDQALNRVNFALDTLNLWDKNIDHKKKFSIHYCKSAFSSY